MLVSLALVSLGVVSFVSLFVGVGETGLQDVLRRDPEKMMRFAGASIFIKMSIAAVFALGGTILFLALVQRVRYADIVVAHLIGIMLGGVIQALTTYLAFQ